MIDLSKGSNFDSYLKKSKEKYGDVQDRAYNNTNLSSNAKNEIKKLDKVIHAAVFTEGFCPDCIVTIPFIQKFSEENSNLKVYYMPRTGFEDFLEEAVGSKSIPTIITFDEDMNPKGAYVETPKELQEKMTGLPQEERKLIYNDYRNGKYNDLIEKNLLDIII